MKLSLSQLFALDWMRRHRHGMSADHLRVPSIATRDSLVRRGLATRQSYADGSGFFYEITEAGERECIAWLAEVKRRNEVKP